MSFVRIIGVVLVLVAAACGDSGRSSEFHSLSVDFADFGGLRLESVSINADRVDDFHRQYGSARGVTITTGQAAVEGAGYVLQFADQTGVDNTAGRPAPTRLSWDRAPFEGFVVDADTTVVADAPPEYEGAFDVTRGGCLTVTAWDLWKLDPPPAQMLGRIEILQPTTATLATTIVIDSTICP